MRRADLGVEIAPPAPVPGRWPGIGGWLPGREACAWRLAAVVACATARSTVRAQQPTDTPRSTARLEVDNDLFAPRRHGGPADWDYTHGTRLRFTRPGAAPWVARLLHAPAHCDALTGAACLLSSTTVGQELYTPRHDVARHVRGDRPYAAWLFGAWRIDRASGATVQRFELRAGVTGPPAFGEPVQNGVHRLLRNHLQVGWSKQLPTHLGVQGDYAATRALELGGSASRLLTIEGGATAGTLRRDAHTGARAYWSFGGAGTPRAEEPLVRHPGRFHLVAGITRAYVAHDALVEGSPGTLGGERIPWVTDWQLGAGARLGRVGLEYRWISQGREYRREPGRHSYGAFAVTVAGR